MVVQVLPPGVQHHQHPDSGAQAFGVSGDFTQRGGSAAHQQIVNDGRVGQSHRAQLGRQREYHMMVLHRQQVLRLLLEPAGAGQGLALGAVAVAARIIGDTLLAAVQTVLDMPAQCGGATACQVAQGLTLHGRQPAAVAIEKAIGIVPDHIRHFQRRPLQDGGAHGWPSAWPPAPAVGLGTTSRSSRLGVCWRRWLLTWR